jgi:hypothetical protein
LKPLEYEAFTLHRRANRSYAEIQLVQGDKSRNGPVRRIKNAEKKLGQARGQRFGDPDAPPSVVAALAVEPSRRLNRDNFVVPRGDERNLRGVPCLRLRDVA